MRIILSILLAILLSVSICQAAEINLTLKYNDTPEDVAISVKNSSRQPVYLENLSFELANQRFDYPLRKYLAPGESEGFSRKIEPLALPGSYPVIITANYLNDGISLSQKYCAIFDFKIRTKLNTRCTIKTKPIYSQGLIKLITPSPRECKIILPDEIKVDSEEITPDGKDIHIKAELAQFRCNYTIFAIIEKEQSGQHFAKVYTGKLFTGVKPFSRGYTPSLALLLFLLIFLGISVFLIYFYPSENSRYGPTLLKYSTRLFFLSTGYLFLKEAGFWFSALRDFKPLWPLAPLFNILSEHFSGFNYNYFLLYVVDLYWLICLIIAFPYLYYKHRNSALETDKYICFMKTLLSLPMAAFKRKVFWNSLSKLGMLTIFVKIFFTPYLTSWVINNTLYQIKLSRTFHWDLITINAYLVALFIYIDTAIYAFGYIVESSALKSRIKTVEPTWLGWIVCLWCYPPFNNYLFDFFYLPVRINFIYPNWVTNIVLCLITILWGIFVWASVALGFKASNLTNRGIVIKGPYRFIRHPAYSAKLGLWILELIFLAQYSLGLIIGFIIIYYLRAWTEERHLSLDPDYLDYKKKVRWMFIPGII